MLIFAACICLAGMVLSVVARYPAILVVIAGLVGVTILAAAQGWSPFQSTGPLLFTLLVEVVAIQVGYAIGILGRSAVASRRARSSGPALAVAPEHPPEIQAGRHTGM